MRDRTAEFQQIVARLQQQQGLPSTSGRDAPAAAGAQLLCWRLQASICQRLCSAPAAKLIKLTMARLCCCTSLASCPLVPPPAAAAASTSGAPQSEFARRAAKIGMGIHSTSQKLQKLAQLARRTSMFDDPAEEINELSTVVKQDIQVRGTDGRRWLTVVGCCSRGLLSDAAA